MKIGNVIRYVVIVEEGDKDFGAYVLDLPGCVAVGETREEVLRLIREAVEALAAYLESPEHPLDTRRFALKAAEGATTVLRERNDLETSVLVGRVRSTAADLLRASGMDTASSLQALREATARAASEERPATTV